mmetsp:Transcript_2481/g.5214  ORF Transcript_2481/g.5214 Transcript_2481/m.5214 type:complete len:406 (-) Transcript_2481:705-1922(-)
MANPLPVCVLSGFLGAGKTTLLRHLVRNTSGVRLALVVNDMADVNVDAAEVNGGYGGVAVLKSDERTVELSNGCICCTLREDLRDELAHLAAEMRFDYVIVESSGISEPMPVAETFTFVGDDGRSLSDVAKLENLVTVVDASSLEIELRSLEMLRDRGWQATEGDARSIAELLLSQIEFANVLLLNKVDLVSESTKKKLLHALQGLNPTAEIMVTTHGELDPRALLGKPRFTLDDAEKHSGWLLEARTGAHVAESEEYAISHATFRALRPFDPQRLAEAMSRRHTSGPLRPLLRMKGVAWIASSLDSVSFISIAGAQLSVQSGPLWSSLPCGADGAHTELVCIGQQMDAAAAMLELRRCLLSDVDLLPTSETTQVAPSPDEAPSLLPLPGMAAQVRRHRFAMWFC